MQLSWCKQASHVILESLECDTCAKHASDAWPNHCFFTRATAAICCSPLLKFELVMGTHVLQQGFACDVTCESRQAAGVWLTMQGLVHSIGVSNFSVKKLQDILSYAEIPPAVSQVPSKTCLLSCSILYSISTSKVILERLKA